MEFDIFPSKESTRLVLPLDPPTADAPLAYEELDCQNFRLTMLCLRKDSIPFGGSWSKAAILSISKNFKQATLSDGGYVHGVNCNPKGGEVVLGK